MLRIYQSRTASDAKRYFTQGLSQEDYYTSDRQVSQRWHGKAAPLLGLTGEVTKDAFYHLCENRHPGTGEPLTPRTREDRTVGYDLTFSAPKGVSLLHGLTQDERIVEAMRDAVAVTMSEIENAAHTRVRTDGRSENRHTGNLVWAEFVHFTTRPVDKVPDPHLHVHAFCQNATFDHDEQRWKAGQFRPIVRDHPYYQAVFHSHLASNLEALGYDVRRTPTAWDLAGIDRGLVEKFSRRTAEIERETRRLGITDPAEKGKLGARTRAGKKSSYSPHELASAWSSWLDDGEAAWLEAVRKGSGSLSRDPGRDPSRVTAEEAVGHALGHVFARRSVESAPRVVAEALKYGLHHVTTESVWAVLDKHPSVLSRVRDGERWVTTREVLAEEREVLSFAVRGKGTVLPLGLGYGGRDGDRYAIGTTAEMGDVTLNSQQAAAVEHLLSSRDRVMLLRGGAGTGKTTLLTEAAAAIQHGGKQIIACAVTAGASRGVLRDAGFDRAETLEKVLIDPVIHEQARGQVIWVDEAGMVGTPTMRRLFRLADEIDARVVLSGDTRQHPPVERGDAMKLLEREAGIRPAEVDEIVRQSGEYKQAVEAMTRGELVESVQRLDQMGAIREIDGEERLQDLAASYMYCLGNKETALVVSPTHAEGRQVTELIRDRLKSEGHIESEERTFHRLQDMQWTDTEKADVHRYEVGMVVQYTRHCKGDARRGVPTMSAGSRCRVIGVDSDTGEVLTEDTHGRQRSLPFEHADRFNVYNEYDLGLSVGDSIRLTKQSKTVDGKHKLVNGAMYRVKGFTDDGNIRLDNKAGWVIGRETGHIAHGYCVTPQAAQGKSVDVCLAAVGAESMTASTLEQMYVILSRGKKRVELLTDQRSALIDAVGRIARQRSAMDLLKETDGPASDGDDLVRHAREVQRLKTFEMDRRERDRAGGRSRSKTTADRDRGLDRDLGRDR